MKRKLKTLIILPLSLFLMSTPAVAAIKAGASCNSQGQVKTTSGFKYTCIKSGKKLVWSKGVKIAVKVATPTATPTPRPTPSPTATPTPTPELLSASDPVESCKIVDASNPYVGVYGGGLYGGFNEKPKPVPSSGTVTWYLVPVDFTCLLYTSPSPRDS